MRKINGSPHKKKFFFLTELAMKMRAHNEEKVNSFMSHTLLTRNIILLFKKYSQPTRLRLRFPNMNLSYFSVLRDKKGITARQRRGWRAKITLPPNERGQ